MSDFNKTVEELKQAVVEFRDERNWKKHHRPKDLAISISVEAAELLEHFQWGDHQEINTLLDDAEWKKEITLEMADVLIYMLSLVDILEIDITDAIEEKLRINRLRFPVDKVKKVSKQDFLKRRREMLKLKERRKDR